MAKKTFQQVVDELNRVRVAAMSGAYAGLNQQQRAIFVQQMNAFLSTGQQPTDDFVLKVIKQATKNSPYEKNWAGLVRDFNATAAQAGGQPEQRGTAGPTQAPAAAAESATPPAGGMGGLAARLGAAARAAAEGRSAAGGGSPTAGGPADRAAAYGPNSATTPGSGGGGSPTADGPADRAAAYGPSPSSTVQQSGPGGANTLGTVANSPYGDNRQTTPGLPVAGTGPGSGSAFTPAQGLNLATDDDRLIRFAMQQAGLNPDRLTSFSKSVGSAIVPLLRSARSAYGIANDNAVDTMPDFFAQLARSLTGQGGNFFGQLRQLGNDTMASQNFKDYLGGVSNPEEQAAMVQALLPIRYAGSNPLIQQSVADTFERQLNAFKDTVFNNSGQIPGGGIFNNFLREQPNLDPITRRIFGL